MALEDSYLYYPYIKVPESTLVHSLLFKDSIKRIMPPHHEMDEFHANQAKRPNDICRQYLGYEFIREADYIEAKKEIAAPFCEFLDQAKSTTNPEKYEPLLGVDYKKRFRFDKNRPTFGTQYIVYAHKFDNVVFEKLESIGWMKFHSDMYACELSDELCNIYMTLLAACISRQTNEPISTGLDIADENLRSNLFKEIFHNLFPENIQANNKVQEVCLNLLLGEGLNELDNPNKIPAHKLLSFPEAVRVRAGLENERIEFCDLVNDLMGKVSLLNISDPEAFVSIEVKDVIEASKDYLNRIRVEAKKQVSAERKGMVSHIQTGLSSALPVAGVAIDVFAGGAPVPGLWTASGMVLGLGTFFLPKIMGQKDTEKEKIITSSRQKAYLFMNRLWTIRDMKLANI